MEEWTHSWLHCVLVNNIVWLCYVMVSNAVWLSNARLRVHLRLINNSKHLIQQAIFVVSVPNVWGTTDKLATENSSHELLMPSAPQRENRLMQVWLPYHVPFVSYKNLKESLKWMCLQYTMHTDSWYCFSLSFFFIFWAGFLGDPPVQILLNLNHFRPSSMLA